jgi:peptidoglycan/xylan/chitin deacetylase (PgdA/CDA1 family)
MRFDVRRVLHREHERGEIGHCQFPGRAAAVIAWSSRAHDAFPMVTAVASVPLWPRIQGFCRRTATRTFFTRPVTIQGQKPIVSFTFDDFPRSAWLTGGAVLDRFGLRGTYYASLGLMGRTASTGPICLPEDVRALVARGHELGCHTFAHCHSWDTKTRLFERSILENRAALETLIPGASFRTFSFPISPPRPHTKRMIAGHFACARGGGQTFNVGQTDLNYLRAYFLEKTRDDREAVRDLIEQNRAAGGWLILATHDVCSTPTPFGCTPEFFEDVVQCAVGSGARILPVAEALEVLRA